METARKRWVALELTIDREAEEAISSALWDEGTQGIVTAAEHTATITLIAYFDKPVDVAAMRARLAETLTQFGFAPAMLHDLSLADVPDEDWMKKWKENWRPFTVGSRFVVTPSWTKNDLNVEPTRVVIEIDPGMAFGTGTHETTKLCLEAIERYWQGDSLLDVGTGTGILAIGAAKLNPEAKRIAACDNDEEAITVARENIEINGVDEIVRLATGSAVDYRGVGFSMVVANLTADVILSILDDLLACRAQGGRLVLSGILDTQEEQVRAALERAGEKVLEVARAGEWIAFISE